MNAWILNGIAGHHFRKAVTDGLKIHHTQIYKEVLHIDDEGRVFTKSGKVYKVVLTEITNGEQQII